MVISQGLPFPGASLTPSLDAPKGPTRVGVGCGLINSLSSSLNMEERWEESDGGFKLSVKLSGEPTWPLPP